MHTYNTEVEVHIQIIAVIFHAVVTEIVAINVFFHGMDKSATSVIWHSKT